MDSYIAVFWNTWFELQTAQRKSNVKLSDTLHQIIDTNSPDFIGLSEIATDKNGDSDLITLLKSRNYYVHFCKFGNISDTHVFGSLFATKNKPLKITEHILGTDSYWTKRGFKDFRQKLIHGEFDTAENSLHIVMPHLVVMRPGNIGEHFRQRKIYQDLLKKLNPQAVVSGGDFNEIKLISSLSLDIDYSRLTGNLLRSTWTWNGAKYCPVRANLDAIYFNRNIVFEDFKILDRAPSDHSPLLIQFRV